jgi:hypothetical protein
MITTITQEMMKQLGAEFAAKCEWKKENILRAVSEALEDANYTYEALDVLQLIQD